MICLVSTPILREDTWSWSGASHLSSPNLTRGLAARWLFRVSPCREGTIYLQTSMSSPGFKPRPYGTAVGAANRYTGWATSRGLCFFWLLDKACEGQNLNPIKLQSYQEWRDGHKTGEALGFIHLALGHDFHLGRAYVFIRDSLWPRLVSSHPYEGRGSPRLSPQCHLSSEQILRRALEVDSDGYSLFGKSRCLANTDYLVIIDKSKTSLQKLRDSLCSTSSSIGLRFNPPKCASLAFYHSRGRRSVDTTDLKILNTPIPSLSGLEAYKYLGMNVGLNFHHDYSCLFDSACEDISKVKNSLLAPWQKLHAIRSIILLRLDFACRNAHVHKFQVERLDKLIVSAAKSIMNLPTRANTTLIHLACRKGGSALPLFRDMLDVHTIGHAFRSLVA
ncbi:reverse transcriptase domain-containing protein [Trichonephila clavipes]|nr:reverse transcriptase domain-containing protein [Trichonephila clavipes]